MLSCDPMVARYEARVIKDRLSANERQRRLYQAAHEYVRGQIDAEAFEKAKCSYGPNYRAAVRDLAQLRFNPLRGLRRFTQWAGILPAE